MVYMHIMNTVLARHFFGRHTTLTLVFYLVFAHNIFMQNVRDFISNKGLL